MNDEMQGVKPASCGLRASIQISKSGGHADAASIGDNRLDCVAILNKIVANNLFISEKTLKRKLREALNADGVKTADFRRAVCDQRCTFRKVDAERASHYAIGENVYYDIRWSQNSGCPDVCIYPEDMIAWELYHGGVLPIYDRSPYGKNTYWGVVDEQLKDIKSIDKSWNGIVDKAASRYEATFVNSVLGLEQIVQDDQSYGFSDCSLEECGKRFGNIAIDGVKYIFVGKMLECPPSTGYLGVRPAVRESCNQGNDQRYPVVFITYNHDGEACEVECEDNFAGFLYDPHMGMVGKPKDLLLREVSNYAAVHNDGVPLLLKAIFSV